MLPPLIAEASAFCPPSNNLAADVDRLLAHYGREVTRQHVPRVTRQAVDLAHRFNVNPEQAQQAALLHDIGGIFERSEMVGLCEALSLSVEAEERQVPLLLHAKLSVVLAQKWQGITDPAILQAIRYHTTLHGQPTPLDEVVFIADKLEWDGPGVPPYHAELSRALETDLSSGVRWMLHWMSTPEAKLLIPHPDLRAAWQYYNVQ